MKNSTNGSASPSLSPDSRLRVWRMRLGTSRDVTTDDVTTGSVGISTAASRKASAQPSAKERIGAEAQQPERDRHGEHQRSRGRSPVVSAAALARPARHPKTGSRSAPARRSRRRSAPRDRPRPRRAPRARSRSSPTAPRSRAPCPAASGESAAVIDTSRPTTSTASESERFIWPSCQQAQCDASHRSGSQRPYLVSRFT